jgi:tetratricopeptide (TPR) repeat protein
MTFQKASGPGSSHNVHLIQARVKRINGGNMPIRTTYLKAGVLLLTCLALLGGCCLLISTNATAQSVDESQTQFLHGNYQDVITTAQKKLAAGSSMEWRILLIKSQLTVGRYDEAFTNAAAGMDDFPYSIRTLLLARETALFHNDPVVARRRLLEMQSLVQRRAQSYQNGENLVALGQTLLLLGVEPRLVLENCFRRAEKMDPSVREAFLAVGELALDKHDFALAADAFRAGLKKFPDDPDLQVGLARAFQSSNREEMLKATDAALAVNPQFIPARLLLADHLIDAEQYDEAEKQLTLILKVNPHRPEALAYRAVLAHLRNDPAQEQQFRAEALKSWKTNPQVDHLIGLKLSQKYRFVEGAAAQNRALAFDPDYLPASRQLAEDLLRLGQNDEGWKLAEAVHKADDYDVTAYNLTVLHDQMAKFQTLSNADFIVHMSPLEAGLYGERVLDLLGRAKETLGRKYGVELTRQTVVEIFPEQKDFAVRTFGMPGNPGYLGVCFGSVITANSPASQAPEPANWEDVLWHEFCHVITLNATKNRMPRWLSEGISVYEERQANPAWGEKMNLAYRDLVRNGELTPLGQLSSAFLTPTNSEHLLFAYYESSLVVEFVIQKFGLEKLKLILSDLRDGVVINQAIAAHTAPLPDIEKQFAAFVREKADSLAPGTDLDQPPGAHSETELLVWEKLHPNNYHLQLRKARELMAAKHWSEAKPVLEALVKSYHGESRADNPLWLLAVTERNLKETDAELATLQKFAAQESDFVELFTRLIEISEARSDWAGVTNYTEHLMAINPLISLPYRAAARANVALGKNDRAIAAYRGLILLDPTDPVEVHYQLARLLHARGDAESEARRQVLQALEDAPRFRDAQQLLLEIKTGKPQPTASAATSGLP